MKRIVLFGWALLILLSGAPPVESGPDFSVTFKEEASVVQERILLGDIARIEGASPLWLEKIAGVAVKESPAPGEFVFVTREEIIYKLRKAGLASLVPSLRIPERIAVLREGHAVDPDTVKEILESRLKHLHPHKTVKIKDLRIGENIIVPSGRLSWDVILPEQAGRGGPVSATILFLVDGREAKKVRVSARVEIYAPVVVTASYLQRHQEITGKDLQLVEKDLALLPPNVLLDVKDVLGKRTTLSINRQEVVCRGMVEVPPAVKKGDRVTLIIENSHFKVTSFGEVQEEGRKGDRIKVVNITSKKEVVGKILDSASVEVDF